jgi:hypothetical protein
MRAAGVVLLMKTKEKKPTTQYNLGKTARLSTYIVDSSPVFFPTRPKSQAFSKYIFYFNFSSNAHSRPSATRLFPHATVRTQHRVIKSALSIVRNYCASETFHISDRKNAT